MAESFQRKGIFGVQKSGNQHFVIGPPSKNCKTICGEITGVCELSEDLLTPDSSVSPLHIFERLLIRRDDLIESNQAILCREYKNDIRLKRPCIGEAEFE